MNLSLEWLSEFMDLGNTDPKTFCDRMTDTGSKVEGYTVLGDDILNVVVGKIVDIKPHENSDHLQVCLVDCGEETLRQIVTGAQNIFVGAFVPAAIPVATLPGGVTIKSGKLRGVPSDGMLCSIGELSLTTNDMPYAIEDGILILNEPDMTPGQDIRDLLSLRDIVVEFEITPNRPDCLSVIGLAREAGASFDRKVTYHEPVVKGCGGDVRDYLDVEVKNFDLCPRYTAKVVKNVKIEPSPLWMRMRLRASGVRPINNIVDITNYVMLEYGQPMHAFDYVCIDGKKIVVREAVQDEHFVSLDSKEHILSEGMLTIADRSKAVALAGIMGGENSEIKDSTSTVVFESANFDGPSVRITSRALGMRTEASGKFEKGLDPENTYKALMRACELVEMLGAGEVVDGVIDVYGKKVSERTIKLEADKINRFLGTSLSEEYMREVLTKLDFAIDGDIIHVPSYRSDVEGMQDIAEEVARIYGYNQIESTPFKGNVKPGMLTPMQSFRARLHNTLIHCGAYESCTFSFVSPKNDDKILLDADSPLRRHTVITNPLGEDTSVMRTSLLPSILDCLTHNGNNHTKDTLIYEISKIYLPSEDSNSLPDERYTLTLGGFGENVDFYTVKGIVETVLETAGIKGAKFVTCPGNPTYHPGRTAQVVSDNGTLLGVVGQLHPRVAENYGFDKELYAFEFDVATLFENGADNRGYKPLPKYPASTRDFAFICDEELEIGLIEETMKKAGGKLVESIELFDIYRGIQLPSGKKSIALSVTMRASDRTLTVEETEKVSQKIINDVRFKLGATLRT